VTSFSELHRDGVDCERWNMLHPDEKSRVPFVKQLLQDAEGPVVSSTDYVRAVSEQIRAFVPGDYRVLGTDGFGRSDSRANLRRHFEIDRYYVVVATLKALADRGDVPTKAVKDAISLYGIDANKLNPLQA
jgi:pyruvate dehydrogenase E1 component